VVAWLFPADAVWDKGEIVSKESVVGIQPVKESNQTMIRIVETKVLVFI